MGFQTTVMLYNDAVGQIEFDPVFGNKLVNALRELAISGGEPVLVCSGGADAALVIESHHADDTALIALGGYQTAVLGKCRVGDLRADDVRLDVLRQVARRLGYRLTPDTDGASQPEPRPPTARQKKRLTAKATKKTGAKAAPRKRKES